MAKRAPQEVFARRISGDPGIAEKLLDVVGKIPTPREGKAADPEPRAREIARKAAAKAAASAGTLALPPGPLGWLTIGPELYAVWKIQAQMVADIAGAYGKPELLTREQMLYCLFGHTAASAFRDLVIRIGERYVVRRAPLSALYAIGNKIALRIAQRSAGRIITRWVPALGALGVAGYVYIDTGRVADTSIELFSSGVRIEGELEVEGVEEMAKAEAASRRTKTGGRAKAKAKANSRSKASSEAAESRGPTRKPASTAKPPSPASKAASRPAPSRRPSAPRKPRRKLNGAGASHPSEG
ncbi:hypothetical protein [Pseudomarimonas salicorniae]|uniref:Uncharacterized protein n=1 Tax=Pseudomarimonas salicorniae TaxID=2933270 RepID=A0ABT0GEP0_9GAMM|nr:hypothetical protein [Lysobacter sp. CAU 1642]MCK7593015.1 hypothetical protein [Lysobacter sp. CAU 1642]